MKKILLVLTGGTIGSSLKNNIINVNSESPYLLLRKYGEKYNNGFDFEVVSPLSILSENINYKILNKLIHYLFSLDFTKYSGIIITHGSDTISYTSAIISMLMRNTPVPIVFTASNLPLEDEKSNGLLNFHSSVCFINNAKIPGIFVSYVKNSGEQSIYLASRLIESDPYEDEFSSFGGEPFGKIEDETFIYNECGINPSIEELNQMKQPIINKKINLIHEVAMIRPYPNLDYTMFDITGKKAVLIYLYHSATASVTGDKTSILKFIERCTKNNVSVYVASLKRSTINEMYKTCADIIHNGAKPLYNISLEAAYAKLCIAYNQLEAEADSIINENIYYEVLT